MTIPTSVLNEYIHCQLVDMNFHANILKYNNFIISQKYPTHVWMSFKKNRMRLSALDMLWFIYG